MSGETDLRALLAGMAPTLDPERYVFLNLPSARYGDYPGLRPVAACSEREGLTLVAPLAEAEAAGLAYDGLFRRITLNVYSSLQAVGLTAAFATALAERGVGANVVAGFFHDHVFVAEHAADLAMDALQSLAGSAADGGA